MVYRTDDNNNPTAFTTDLAAEAGLVEGTDYEQGDPFTISGHQFYTAKILGNALSVTIRLIDKVGFYTTIGGVMRWIYIAIPYQVWLGLSYDWKVYTIGQMYQREGGTAMKGLFGPPPQANPINLNVSEQIKFSVGVSS